MGKPVAQITISRPSMPPPAAVEAFINSTTERPLALAPELRIEAPPEVKVAPTEQEPEVSPVSVARAAGKGAPRAKKGKARGEITLTDGTVRVRFSAYFEAETAKRLRVHCATHGLAAADVVEEAVAAFLRRNG